MAPLSQPPSPPAPPRPFRWTDEQKAVLGQPAPARLLVEAAPGTGKTAVACARAVRLIAEEDVPPSAILMVSFTRTAVAEMRKRMQLMLPDGRAHAINISTLDQTAFTFGIGCGAEFDRLMGSFEGNIDNALKALTSGNALLRDYLGRLRHIIVDEAQDITGTRARFMAEVLAALRPQTGVTVFADRAQSIFGFSSDLDDDGIAERDFLALYDFRKAGYIEKPLSENHRCENPALQKVFADSRQALHGKKAGIERVRTVMAVVESVAADEGSAVQELPLVDGDLVLFRKRGSALMFAQHCPGFHRLRMPGYPAAVFPWIAGIFSSWTSTFIAADVFAGRWRDLPPCLAYGYDAVTAWSLLRQFAGDSKGAVDVPEIRRLVARSRPPVELCMLDCGGHGPVFSTIHASKGREADRVYLMLPRNLEYLGYGTKPPDPEEEARVFYVGSTRMRKEIHRGTAQTMKAARALQPGSRRVAQLLDTKVKFQVGLDGDLLAHAPVSREPAFCADAASAAAAQQRLAGLWDRALRAGAAPEVTGELVRVTVNSSPQDAYRFLCEGAVVAWSDVSLLRDLRTLAEKRRAKYSWSTLQPPPDLGPLRLIGLRTAAIPEGPVHAGRLQEPYATSGLFLAPLVSGFPSPFFKFIKT